VDRVGDRVLDVGPRRHGHVARHVRLVGLHVGRRDSQPTSREHGVAGVHHEVHQHLLALAWVGPRKAKVWLEHLDPIGVLTENSPQHLLNPDGDLVQIQRNRLRHLLAAERQKLTSERRRALASFLRLQEVILERVALLPLPHRELRVAQDHGAQVVEVVCHAAREKPARRTADPLLVIDDDEHATSSGSCFLLLF